MAGVLIWVSLVLSNSVLGEGIEKNIGQPWLSVSEAAEGGLPVVHGGARKFRGLLKALATNHGDPSSTAVQKKKLDSSYPWSKYEMGDARGWTGFFVISGEPELAVDRLRLLFKSLGAVPFIPKPEGNNINTVFVSEHGSSVFYNGYGISPMAARISSSGEEIEIIHPALSEDGEVVLPGPLSGPTERISVGTSEVFVVTRDSEGRGMAKSQRPRPRRPVLIAWDGELVQLPPLPYDEFGVDERQFWIQRNVNSFEVPGGRESPFFATSVHCAHYIYQYSLVDPMTGEPTVMMVRLDFAAEGARVSPARVRLDIEPADEFRGKAISCREFATKNDILNGRFGLYKGEIRTKRDESENGEAYLAVSKALSLRYFAELRAWSQSLDSSAVVVSPKVQGIFDDLQLTALDRSAIDGTEVVEMGGSNPGSYLSILTKARTESTESASAPSQ